MCVCFKLVILGLFVMYSLEKFIITKYTNDSCDRTFFFFRKLSLPVYTRERVWIQEQFYPQNYPSVCILKT